MKSRARRSRISFFFSCLFATSTLFAQPPADTTTSAYLDFGRFSTIAPADQLGFLDKLKWAGMIFVNAPAARRVVSLYDYTKRDIMAADCSSDRIRNHHALLVASLVPTDAVIAALDAIEQNSGNKDGDHDDVLSGLRGRSWVAQEDPALKTLLQEGNDSSSALLNVPEPELVWHEFSFSNSCELRELIESLNYDDLHWRFVDDPKLRSVIQSVSDSDAQEERIIVAERLFPEATRSRQYFAECEPSSELPLADGSLCDTMP